MKISVIMCVMNSMPYVMASVQSFIDQKYKNKELIIVYSKSTDNTFQYLKSLNNKNIKIFKYNGKGVYSALNFGIKKTSGEIIGILHSDDLFYDKKTIDKIAQIYKKKKSDILFGKVFYCSKNNILKIRRTWRKIGIEKNYNLPPHTSTFIKKTILSKIKYNNNYDISGDTDLLLKLFRNKLSFSYINKYLTIMRHGGLSTNIIYILKKIREDIKIYKNNNLSILDYIKKILFKLDQVLIKDKIKILKYHHQLNKYAGIKFLKIEEMCKPKGKIFSALNLAFISFNYKYQLRTHNYLFWPDGIFSKYLLNKSKVPGREIFKKLISKLGKNKKNFRKIYVIGSIPKISKKYLNKKFNFEYNHINLPYKSNEQFKKFGKKLNLEDESFIILTLPTPKQEILANEIIKINPNSNILCLGGTINILSGHEKQTPDFFNLLNLEWLWRLKFDSKRRIKRLVESFIILLKLVILRKNTIF